MARHCITHALGPAAWEALWAAAARAPRAATTRARRATSRRQIAGRGTLTAGRGQAAVQAGKRGRGHLVSNARSRCEVGGQVLPVPQHLQAARPAVLLSRQIAHSHRWPAAINLLSIKSTLKHHPHGEQAGEARSFGRKMPGISAARWVAFAAACACSAAFLNGVTGAYG